MEKRGQKPKIYGRSMTLTICLSAALILLFLILTAFPSLLSKTFTAYSVSGLIYAVAIMLGFYAFDRLFDVQFKARHYYFMAIIVALSFITGEMYFIYANYDKILHIIQPMMACSMIFYMVDKLKIENKWKLLFTFFIVAGILGIFEVAEFGLDKMFDLKLQGVFVQDSFNPSRLSIVLDPLSDTHMDLIVGYLGSAIYLLTFGCYLKKKSKKS